MSSELSQVIIKMNGEINQIMERNLFPHFETIRIIETLLKQLPEFKRLEQENVDLKKRLSLCMELSNLETNNQADIELSNQEIHNDMQVPVTLAPVTLAPVTLAPVTLAPVTLAPVTLDIVETQSSNHKIVSEDELYETVDLLNHTDNKLQTVEEEEDEEEESGGEGENPSEEEEEVETSASEADEEEEEEEVVETSASEADEEEEESGGEGENPPEEAEASEAEEEEEEEEGENPPEEGGVGENPPEEEVFMIEIKGKGKFYTSNETNGDIYAIEGEDDVGDVVGKFVNKVAIFN